MQMNQFFEMIAENFTVATIAGVFLVGMLLKAATTVLTTSSRERSRREIAAYIAEGSMTPEQGERLMRADLSRGMHV
jgi:hypothetical protein